MLAQRQRAVEEQPEPSVVVVGLLEHHRLPQAQVEQREVGEAQLEEPEMLSLATGRRLQQQTVGAMEAVCCRTVAELACCEYREMSRSRRRCYHHRPSLGYHPNPRHHRRAPCGTES